MSRKGERPRRRRSISSGSANWEQLESRRLLSGGYTFANASSNAIAMDSGGKLYVAYYDTSAQILKYAIRESDGTWSTTGGTIDSSPAVGVSVVMDLDSTGKPGVAYTDSNNADLKYAHWNGSTWDVQTVGGSAGKLGYYPSLRYASDKPTISHFVKTSPNGAASTGYLRVDQGNSVNATSWSTSTSIDTSGDAGRFSSIRYNSVSGKWGVSYDDDVNVVAKFAESSTSSITSTWSKTSIAPAPTARPGGAFWTSLVYDGSGKPAFAYYDSTEYNVNVAYRNGTGGTWINTIVDSNNTTGKYPNLVNDSGTFRVAYYDDNEHTAEVQHSSNGTTWTRDADLVVGAGSELKALRRGSAWTFAWQGGDNVYVNNDQSGMNWVSMSSGNLFGGRARHSSVVFNPNDANNPGDAMWVIGGATGSTKRNDTYASNDGVNWRRVHTDGDTTHPAFSGRTNFAALVFDNNDTANPGAKMWVIGGQPGGSDSSNVGDVWWSLNGQDWTQALDSNGAPVSVGARRDHAAAVYNGRMYVIGGIDENGQPANTVKSSADGITWTTETGVGTLANRYGATAMVYKGALYVFGGTGLGSNADVKTYKFNGSSWSQVGLLGLAPLNVSSLSGGDGFVYDDKMWYLGGGHAYWSNDGFFWTQALDDLDFVTPFVDGRVDYTALAFTKPGDSPRMWLIGGYNNNGRTYDDDVWSSD